MVARKNKRGDMLRMKRMSRRHLNLSSLQRIELIVTNENLMLNPGTTQVTLLNIGPNLLEMVKRK